MQKNIRGSLSGTVTVSQAGGYDPRYGHVVLIYNDPLLKPGQEAVFSVRKDSPGGPYFMVGGTFSHVEIETEEQEARVVDRFREARRAQNSPSTHSGE